MSDDGWKPIETALPEDPFDDWSWQNFFTPDGQNQSELFWTYGMPELKIPRTAGLTLWRPLPAPPAEE